MGQRERNDYDNNCKLRKVFQTKKKRKLKLQKHAENKGLAIELLEFTKEDRLRAKAVKFKKEKGNVSARKKMKKKRSKLESESIFATEKKKKKRKKRKLSQDEL